MIINHLAKLHRYEMDSTLFFSWRRGSHEVLWGRKKWNVWVSFTYYRCLLGNYEHHSRLWGCRRERGRQSRLSVDAPLSWLSGEGDTLSRQRSNYIMCQSAMWTTVLIGWEGDTGKQGWARSLCAEMGMRTGMIWCLSGEGEQPSGGWEGQSTGRKHTANVLSEQDGKPSKGT